MNAEWNLGQEDRQLGWNGISGKGVTFLSLTVSGKTPCVYLSRCDSRVPLMGQEEEVTSASLTFIDSKI